MFDPRTIGIRKFGRNADVDAAEDIWSPGGTYTFASAAETLYLSSSDNADTMEMTVVGYDADGLETTEVKALTGQTGVALAGTWLRMYRAYVSGATGPAGDVYVGTEATPGSGVPALGNTRAKIDVGVGQTLMAITSIPVTVGTKTVKTAWISNMLLTVLPGSPAGVDVEFGLFVKAPGGIFLRKCSCALTDTQPTLQHPFHKYIEVAPLSDIKLRVADVSAANTIVSGEFTVFYEV